MSMSRNILRSHRSGVQSRQEQTKIFLCTIVSMLCREVTDQLVSASALDQSPTIQDSSTLSTTLADAAHRLASMAFRHVLGKKQSRYRDMIIELDQLIEVSNPKRAVERIRMDRIVRKGNQLLQGYK